MAAGGGRRGEVDHRVGLGEELDGVVPHQNAERRLPDEQADVGADGRAALLVAAADDDAALGRLNGGEVHAAHAAGTADDRSEEHTSELQSLMRISYAVFCLKKKKNQRTKRG